MSNDKMREEFERTNGRDHRRQPPKGNNYIDPMAQADWESFQKGWAQSREALVIELPASPYMPGAEPQSMTGYEIGEAQGRCDMWVSTREAIEAAGVRCK